MREDEAAHPRAPRLTDRILPRIASAGAHVSGAVLLAAGFVNTFAARRGRDDDKRDGDGNNGHDRDRDNRQDRDDGSAGGKSQRAERGGNRDQAPDREREDRESDQERKDHDAEREQSEDSGRNRDRTPDAGSDTDDDVNSEQNRRNRNRDDEPDDSNDEGGGGNNAGSALFDSPLATKARRRANDFDNTDRDDEEEDGIVVDVDPEGESIYQTESISYATGPDGIEILTRNITYTAVPTPTPTPFPRLEFPERDGYPFGEDFPFGVVRPTPTPGGAVADPGDTPADPGDTPPSGDPVPTTPPMDGGDNSTDFAS